MWIDLRAQSAKLGLGGQFPHLLFLDVMLISLLHRSDRVDAPGHQQRHTFEHSHIVGKQAPAAGQIPDAHDVVRTIHRGNSDPRTAAILLDPACRVWQFGLRPVYRFGAQCRRQCLHRLVENRTGNFTPINRAGKRRGKLRIVHPLENDFIDQRFGDPAKKWINQRRKTPHGKQESDRPLAGRIGGQDRHDGENENSKDQSCKEYERQRALEENIGKRETEILEQDE